MADIQSFIGQSSSEGDRKRLYRQKIDEEQSKWDICPLEVGHLSDICPPEIEIEIEIEKKKEKKKEIYTPKFLSAWELYPHGLTKDKDQSFRNWMGKVNKHGFTEDDLLLAAQHYAKFCVLLDTSTEYRTLFSNFYGMKGTFKQFIDYDFTQLERDKRNAESKKESYAPKTPFDIYGCPADWGT
jgi:hypothetical protein